MRACPAYSMVLSIVCAHISGTLEGALDSVCAQPAHLVVLSIACARMSGTLYGAVDRWLCCTISLSSSIDAQMGPALAYVGRGTPCLA